MIIEILFSKFFVQYLINFLTPPQFGVDVSAVAASDLGGPFFNS